jgi:hypothetical protein
VKKKGPPAIGCKRGTVRKAAVPTIVTSPNAHK